MHDLRLDQHPAYRQTPSVLRVKGCLGYREAESAYTFDGPRMRRVCKRWVPHRSPPELYNHGFENLESLGALYSRVSSHVFGDWNACGKVMGLGPWAQSWSSSAQQAAPSLLRGGCVEGVGEEALAIDWAALEGLPHCNGFATLLSEAGDAIMDDGSDPSRTLSAELAERRGYYAALSARVQLDLEAAALAWLRGLQQRTGETRLCLVGGVAQNSVLNGRIAREAGFEEVFIPPYPGDEGIAAGCAAYAQRVLLPAMGVEPPPVRAGPWSAYQGRHYSDDEVAEAIDAFSPWLEEVAIHEAGGGGEAGSGLAGGSAEVAPESEASVPPAAPTAAAAPPRTTDDRTLIEGGAPADSVPEALVRYAADALARGEIIAWCHGRAEVGARALGHRSILANPTLQTVHRRVNTVKQREQYRPLAPSVLAESADDWFEGVPSLGSPYMQITATVRAEVRDRVPAITHVDGSARLQTVDAAESPLYHALIAAFCALVGVPMVLNTSFNLNKMPVVESPADALGCFLDADSDLSLLVLFGRVLRRRPFPDKCAVRDATPRQQRSFVSRSIADPAGVPRRVEVLVEGDWLPLTDPLELELLECCAAGDTSVAEIMAELVGELTQPSTEKAAPDQPSTEEAAPDQPSTEEGVSEDDVYERLRHLFELRLISV